MTNNEEGIAVREYQTMTHKAAYSVSYGHPDGHTILVTPDGGGKWVVWHSDSLGTLYRGPLNRALSVAEARATERVRAMADEASRRCHCDD